MKIFNAKFPDLHVHSGEGSLRDTGSKASELVAREKELGATAMAITDHGTMAAIQDFRVACENAGIKPIYGCEFYVDIGDEARTHFIVLAKNFNGYQAISKVNTETAYNLKDGKPIATLEMLSKWFGPGSLGYNNVIATSACIAGPLCRKILQNYQYEDEIAKLAKKRDKELSPDNEKYVEALGVLQRLEAEHEECKAQTKYYTELAKKTWKKQYNQAIKSGDETAIAEVEALKASIESAATEKVEKKKLETKKNNEVKLHKEVLAPLEKSVAKYTRFNAAISEVESKKVSSKTAINEAESILQYLCDLFGKENYYIELQYHGIDKEATAMPILVDIARKYNIPLTAANDVHYATKDKAEARNYNFIQHASGFWKEMEPADYELYIKDSNELADALSKILPDDAVEEAIDNTFKIAEQCNVTFEIGTHYPKFPCKEGAKFRLCSLIKKGKKKIPEWDDNEIYQKRLEYELNTILNMGFADYLCIVEDFLEYARIIGKLDLNSQEFIDHQFDIKYLEKMAEGQVGEGCGPGRGSAAGSLVCYLIGITNIDPIKNDLLFERFLNPQRVTMPDIDSDIAPNVRPYIIEYIKNRYGEKSVCQIMTLAYFGAKSSIQAAARIMGKKAGDEKAFLGLSLQLSKSIDDAKASIDDIENDLLAINDSDEAKEMIAIAKELVGLPSGYGTHAAGIVISDNDDVSDYTPLMNVSGAIDCQLNLNWVEPMGMLKLDLLGLRNLGIITECEKAVQKNYGINLSMDQFPEDPEVFENIFAKAQTNGVFQFESDGMKKTLANFGPDSIADLTLLNAIFRPGPLQYIDEVTAIKHGEKEPEYIIPEMATILENTYSKPIYQEEIMAIFNQLAGFSLGESDIIRRYMSKKKYDKFAAYKDKFITGLMCKGATEENANKFWDELLDFSAYAFNKSHSRAYAEVAYATAYLKYHYPEAYACGLLNYTPNNKMAKMILDAKNQKVNLRCPDINLSDAEFSLHGSDVVFGLRPIPQVSASALKIIEERTENGPYKTFKEFLARTYPKKNVAENLIKSGAFDKFGNRADLLAVLPELLDILKKIKLKEDLIASETDEKKVERAKISLAGLKEDYEETEIETVSSNKLEELNTEKELLGYYVSAHPMERIKTKPNISSLEADKTYKITALATDLDYKNTKAGKEMLFVNLSDNSDIIEGIVFPSDLEKIDIEENKIYSFFGTVKEDGDTFKFYIKDVKPFKMKEEVVYLDVPSKEVFDEKKIQVWEDAKNGVKLVLYFKKENKYYPYTRPVDKAIKKAKIDW